jgi:hypothetical protein
MIDTLALMWLIDSWFIAGNDSRHRETIARGQRRFAGD